jgi:hypothetical protein
MEGVFRYQVSRRGYRHNDCKRQQPPIGRLPCALVYSRSPSPHEDGGDRPSEEHQPPDAEIISPSDRRNRSRSIRHENQTEDGDAVLYPRNRKDHRDVPEDHLDQERRVAEDLNVDQRDFS